MGILESVQHGLEKASQQASYIAKMQHLHTVINDLTYKSSLDHQALATKTMELFKAGHLTQSELLPMCQELDNYLQQIDEVQGELKKMQDNPPAGHTAQPGAPAAPPQGYLAYPPQGAPAPPQGYPPYPPPPQG